MSDEPLSERIVYGDGFAMLDPEFVRTTGSFDIPDGVTRIYPGVFANCKTLASIGFPSSLKEIGDYAFIHCESLKDVMLPPGITKIGSHAFDDCYSVSELALPSARGRPTDGWSKVLSGIRPP